VKDDAAPYVKSAVKVLKMAGVFFVFAMTATFFRAYDLDHVMMLWESILTFPYSGEGSARIAPAGDYAYRIFKIVIFLVFLDAMSYFKNDVFWIFKKHAIVRSVIYIYMFLIIVTLGVFGREVIYFAF
ncbi:MAG: hypothetical protein OEZ34_12415, partial [Spirochaetia bacterium]|nr:hypothetical protein [Spirochaetia bacterium]